MTVRSWGQAIQMYRRRYTFVGVGPRMSEDWADDVAGVMCRAEPDPKGWAGIDPEIGEEELLEDPAFPFLLPPPPGAAREEWRTRLRSIPGNSVEKLLVMLSTVWLNVTEDRSFEEKRADCEAAARVISSRFPEGASFMTNTRHGGSDPDFYERVSGTSPLSRYNWDIGLLVIAPEEVAMIWSFDPL